MIDEALQLLLLGGGFARIRAKPPLASAASAIHSGQVCSEQALAVAPLGGGFARIRANLPLPISASAIHSSHLCSARALAAASPWWQVCSLVMPGTAQHHLSCPLQLPLRRGKSHCSCVSLVAGLQELLQTRH